MISKMKLAVAFGVASFAVAGPASAAQIFYDSFEEPDVATWAVFSTVGDNSDWELVEGAGIEIQDESIGITDAYDGEQYVELDSDNARGGLPGDTNSGMIANMAFVEGRTYEVSFAYKPRTNTPNDNKVSLYAVGYDGSTISPVTLLLTANETTSSLSDWLVYSAIFTAEAGHNAIGFLAQGIDNSLGGFIDAVSVSEVPIPAALPLFLAGIAGFGFAGRKRKTA